MEEKSTATLEKIQRAAMEEFTEKGFQGCLLYTSGAGAGKEVSRLDPGQGGRAVANQQIL